MTILNITIDMDNDAFGVSSEERGDELRPILNHVTLLVTNGYDAGTLADSNGNTVGSWSITEDE